VSANVEESWGHNMSLSWKIRLVILGVFLASQLAYFLWPSSLLKVWVVVQFLAILLLPVGTIAKWIEDKKDR
jgi:hypothetical protein